MEHPITPPPEPLSPAAAPVREGPIIDDIRQLCVDNELLMFVDSGDFDTVVVAIMEIVCAALARWGRPATPPPEPPTVMEIFTLIDEIDEARLGQIDLVRAALERWGQR